MWIVKVTNCITYWYTSFVRAVPSNILEHKFTNRYILQNPPPHCYWKAEGLSEMHPISYQSRSLSPLMLFQFSYFIQLLEFSYFQLFPTTTGCLKKSAVANITLVSGKSIWSILDKSRCVALANIFWSSSPANIQARLFIERCSKNCQIFCSASYNRISETLSVTKKWHKLKSQILNQTSKSM